MGQNVNYMGDSKLKNMEEGNHKDETLFGSKFLSKIILFDEVGVEDKIWHFITQVRKNREFISLEFCWFQYLQCSKGKVIKS